MRRLFLLLVCIISPFVLQAKVVTEKEALQKAQDFMQGKQFSKRNLTRAQSDETKEEPYYIFNIVENNGFLIVAGNDQMPDILGYSEKGNFDLSKAPDNVKWLMDYYAQIAKSLKESNYSKAKTRAPSDRSEVQPLIKTTWDQYAPYCDYCPVVEEGYLTPTGCVATAMAQVINFFQWPLTEVKAVAEYTTSDKMVVSTLPSKKFNWYNMTDDDIAWLMRYCGQSVMMDYKADESSAAPGNIPYALTSVFGYSKSTKLANRSSYSDNDWEELMYNEVNLGRPVIYSGFQGSSGHTFVVHGYRDGMFMVNWGWSGSFDGYFTLTNLAPNEYMNFSDDQNAVVGIQPAVANSNAEGISMTINVEEAGTLSTYISDDIKYTVSNLVLTGDLNGTDFRLIRDMAGNNYKGEITEGKLENIDLSDATIVEGGDPYIETQDVRYTMKDNNMSIYVESPKVYSSTNKISSYLFAGCTSLKYIRIPNNTIEIETKAFDGTNLKEIFIPKSVTKIDIEAFNNSWRELSSISIAEDNSVYTTLGNYNAIIEKETGKLIIAFCSTTIVPEGVKIIGTNAFKGCSTNGGLWPELPESLTTIEEFGMEWLNGRTVFIPKNVSTIGNQAIPTGAEFIIVDKDNTVFDSRNDCNAVMETASNTLIYGSRFTEIPVDAISIADNAILGFRIKDIVIPENIKSIGESAFGTGGEGLETVTVLNAEPIEIPENTFYIAASTAKLIIPDGSKEKYENAVGWNKFTTIVESSSYSSSVTLNVSPAGSLPNLISENEKYSIGNLKLTGELNGTDLNFLHEMMGYNSEILGSLKSLDLSDAKIVEGGSDGHFSKEDVLGESVFGESPSLKQLVLPKTLKRIEANAFKDQLIKSIVIPKSVEEIGDYAFYYCPLESISVEEGNPVFDSRDNCNAIIETATNTLRVGCRKTIIPNSVRAIGRTAFSGKDGMRSITIPEGVTSIEDYAFWADNDLISVNIPKSVVNFGISPFGGCAKITSFTIDSENPIYDSRDNCNGIIETATNTLIQGFANTTIPEGVTTIGERALTMQEFLTSIEIPKSVTDIKPRAFQFSHQLGKVTCHIKKPLTISNTVFETDHITDAILYVPYGTKAAYASAPGWDVFGNIIEMEPDDSYQNNSASIEIADFGRHYAALNGEVNVPISITGEGLSPITSIDYTINNSAEQHLEVEPINYMMTSEVLIPFAADAAIGEVAKTLKITKVNGVANECTENITATGTLVTVTKKPKITPVVEEYTGTWCGWCSRGLVGLKMLNKQFGKDVITIAIHDGSENEPMMLPEYRSTYWNYPSCQINRGDMMDPYFGNGQSAFGIKKEVEASQRDYALGSIEALAEWTDDTHTAINIKTTTTFVEDVAESPYQIGYILLEDGVTGTGDAWAQSNYYAGSNTTDENLKELTSKPSKITDMRYNNVPVAAWEPMTGVDGTVPTTITHDVSMEYTFTADISDNTRIQNKNRLTVVVLLLDKNTGKIVNAAKVPMSILGDVTSNGAVDVQDATVVVNYILENESDEYNYNVADMNNDNEVDVFDVTAIVNVILNSTPATTRVYTTRVGELENINISSIDNELIFGIEKAERFTSFQFDVELPQGVDLQDVRWDGAGNQHTLQFAKNGENHYAVVALSMSSTPLMASGNGLLRLKLAGDASGDLVISNIVFVSPQGEATYFNNSRMNITTGICGIVFQKEDGKIYDLSGRQLNVNRNQLGKGIYIINNKKVVIQ